MAGVRRGDSFGLERLAFFSDAVFAIAITLLALDLRLPDRPGGYTDAELLRALADLMPSVFAFALSFAVIAGFWVGHYRTLRFVAHGDSRFIGLNLAFLLCVAILPFPTSIVAQEGDLPSAAILYACFGLAAGTLSTMLWVYPTQIARLASPLVTPELARHVAYRAWVVPIAFALSIPVALVSPFLAETMWLLSLIVQALVARHFDLGASLERSLGDLDERGPGPDGA